MDAYKGHQITRQLEAAQGVKALKRGENKCNEKTTHERGDEVKQSSGPRLTVAVLGGEQTRGLNLRSLPQRNLQKDNSRYFLKEKMDISRVLFGRTDAIKVLLPLFAMAQHNTLGLQITRS